MFFSLYPLQITAETENVCIVKDGLYRKLIVKNCKEEDAGKYKCEADGRKTEAALIVEGTIFRFEVQHLRKATDCQFDFPPTRSPKNEC